MEEVFSKKPVKIVEIPLMTAGLCGYGDNGNVYISDSTMYTIMPKLLGVSVILTHQGQEAIGEVVDVFQDLHDTDRWKGKLSIRDEEAIRLLESGWGVSTAYRITDDTGRAGKWNNIDYNTEVEDVDWLHVAIVENPRYTVAKDGFFLNSGNDNIIYTKTITNERRTKPMFNLFKTKKEKINLNEDEKMFVKVGEDEIELSDLIEFVKKEEDKKKFVDDDMMIELNGESITVKELVEKYNACKKNACKKNEEKEEIKEEKKEEIKDNEDHKEDEKDNEEIKEEKIEEKKEEIKDNEEDKKDEDKKDNEDKDEDKKDNEEKIEEEKKEEVKEIKNSIDLRNAYENRGSGNVKLNGYLTIKERMELAHKKYGISK